jgi:F-type H+-transporting ATPase subunit a
VIAGVSTEFIPPGPQSFDTPPIFAGVEWFTKPVLVAALSVIVIVWFFWGASRKAAVVPSKLQFAGELGYNFVRNSIARDAIGSQDHMKYVPYLCGLFFFILFNNVAASIPLIQFPTFSHIGWAYVAAMMSWVIYNAVGIKKHGFVGYFKLQSVPAGIKGPILLLVFVLGGEYMILHSGSLALGGVGILTLLMGIAIAGLELFVQCIQAYIFVVLTAQYIGSAIADEH